MNIFKSFEIFLREPLSILREKFIQIVNVNSNLVTQSSINVETLARKKQITVVNSDKMYNLLKTVQLKQEKKAVERLLEPTQPKQILIGQLFGRV